MVQMQEPKNTNQKHQVGPAGHTPVKGVCISASASWVCDVPPACSSVGRAGVSPNTLADSCRVLRQGTSGEGALPIIVSTTGAMHAPGVPPVVSSARVQHDIMASAATSTGLCTDAAVGEEAARSVLLAMSPALSMAWRSANIDTAACGRTVGVAVAVGVGCGVPACAS